MTQDDIIRMAREAGVISTKIDGIERFAALVAAAEREACANVCDDKHHTWRWGDGPDSESGPKDCAAAIRARSQQ